jgi:hypothetical protein
MALGPKLQAKLSKQYQPSRRYDEVFKDNDITYITDEAGNPITLYIGERQEDGSIKGELYVRHFKRDSATGRTTSHWDNKGKVTRIR